MYMFAFVYLCCATASGHGGRQYLGQRLRRGDILVHSLFFRIRRERGSVHNDLDLPGRRGPFGYVDARDLERSTLLKMGERVVRLPDIRI